MSGLEIPARRALRRLLQTAAWIALFPAAVWSAEPARKFVDPVCQPLLDLLARPDGTPTSAALWDAVQASPLKFETAPGNCDFACELMYDTEKLGSPDVMQRFSIVCDARKQCRGAVLQHFGRPVLVMLDNAWYLHDDQGRWVVLADSRWGIDPDTEKFPEPSHVPAADGPDECGHLSLSLIGMLRRVMDRREPTVSWQARLRTLTMDKGNGSTVLLRLRTPGDALRYGTAVGELRMHGRAGGEIAVRAFELGTDSPARLGHGSYGDLAAKVDAESVDADGKWSLQSSDPLTFARAGSGAGRMRTELDRPAWEARSDRAEATALRATLEQSAAVAYVEHEDGTFEVAWKSDPADATGQVRALTETLEAVADLIPADEGRHPDDPAMIGREAEAAAGAPLLFDSLIAARLLLARPDVPGADKAALLDAVGDLGWPAVMQDGSEWLSRSVSSPGVEALLRSRWGLPCEEEHVEAAAVDLPGADPGSPAERAFVETLLRLDAAGRVPADALDRWYAAEVAGVPSARRRRSLAYATVQPSGRAWLLARLPKEADAEVRAAVAHALRGRAEATRATGMFDFMSEEDCARTLEAVAED